VNQQKRLYGLLAVVLTLGCSDPPQLGPAPDVLDREVFIATYVALRVETLRSQQATIEPASREQILKENGITSDDLLEFADYYGSNIPFMRDVWNDVEATLTDIRNQTPLVNQPGTIPMGDALRDSTQS